MREEYSHMTKDQLSAESLTYIENLKKQISEIYDRYNVRTQADLKALSNREDVDTVTLKKLQVLFQRLKHTTETNELPRSTRAAESAVLVHDSFQFFYTDIQKAMESDRVEWYEKLGCILAVARAGEPKLAWDLYNKTPLGPGEFEVQALVAIFEADVTFSRQTITPTALFEKFTKWNPSIAKINELEKLDLRDRLLLDFFRSAAKKSAILHDFSITHILFNMQYAETKMRALDFAESFMTCESYQRVKQEFDDQLTSMGEQIQIEYHSLQYVKNGYHNAPNEDTLKRIKELSFETTQGPLVHISAAAAFARIGLVDEAFAMHEKLDTTRNQARSSVGMAAAFLEGPRIDIENAKRALQACPLENCWMDSSYNVLKIIRPLIDAGEVAFTTVFIEAYCRNGKRTDELLLQAAEVFTDANLFSEWTTEELALEPSTNENKFLLAAARITRTIREFKREVQNIRKLNPSEMISLFYEFSDDDDVQDGVVLSMSGNDLSHLTMGLVNDPHTATVIQDTRQNLENRYGKDFLDSLVYGNVSI